MEEKRIERVGDCMKTFADVDRQVLPIVGKCLDGMTKAAESIDAKTVSSRRYMQASPLNAHSESLTLSLDRYPMYSGESCAEILNRWVMTFSGW